jgi:hypothetical protein
LRGNCANVGLNHQSARVQTERRDRMRSKVVENVP